ncbi:hypothetical protein [Streptomyces sp. NPDC096311]|uniref:hypothetical protein n=1 Tax=Streptomyces sp. NPDC096311 TaxID=3366083 RepID=UPI003813AF2D
MNFGTPLSALFPGTSGRLLTALVDHHSTDATRPLPLDELSKNAAVTSTQLEAALFRLGLLGLIAPRRKGEAVHLVPGHVVWAALHRLTDLRDAVIDRVREETQQRLQPAPDYLALNGAVIEGTATHPADVLELIVVPPPTAQADWHRRLATLVTHLSRDLGNVVVHRTAQNTAEAKAMSGTNAVPIFLT